MRFVIFFLLVYSNGVRAIIQKDGSSKNSFIHKFTESSKENKRRVTFSGYTFPQNMNSYILSAENEKSKSAKHDEKIDIEIENVHVIELNGNPNFNKLTAYIIKTKDGRYFLKYQIRLRRVVNTLPINMLGRFVPESRGAMSCEGFITPRLHAGIRVTGTTEEMEEHMKTLPSSMNYTEFHYLVWVTTLVTPGTAIWNMDTQVFHFGGVIIGYSVIEEASL